MAQTEEALPPQTLHYAGTTATHAHTNRLTHMLTITTFLTNAHRHKRKIYSNKVEIILQPKKQKRIEVVAIGSDRSG